MGSSIDSSRQGDRILESKVMDWLRFPMAALVVVNHTGSMGGGSPYPVYSTLCILFPEAICRLAVPLFFLISGYFVPKSFDRQGFWPFIGKKVLRLIVPVVAVTALLTTLGGQLEAGHTWFLESLFLFCLCYALIRLATKNKTVK